MGMRARTLRMEAEGAALKDRAPAAWRIVLAFLAAPLAPAFLYALQTLFDGLPNGSYFKTGMTFAVLGGYPAALLFGVPLFFALRNRVDPRLWVLVLAGGGVAAAPWILLTLFAPQPDQAQIGTRITVLDGRMTLWGWLESGAMIGQVFLLGAVGGLVFWLAAVAVARPKPS